MSRILYFDCFSGASGDMIAGALLDAGVPFDVLARVVDSLGLDGVAVGSERVDRSGIGAVKFRVTVDGEAADAPAAASRHAQEHGRGEDHAHGAGEDHSHGAGHGHAHGADHSHGTDHGQDHSHGAGHSHGDAGHGHAHGHSHGTDHSHGADHGHDHSHGAGHAHGHSHGHDDGHSHGGSRHHHRGLTEINEIVGRSSLSPAGRARAARLFRRLAEVEAGIHQVPVETVRLHEVGAVDSIVDVVAAVCALEWLAPDRVVASSLNVGSGTVRCEHGELPVPAPATAELLLGVPVYAAGPPAELVTPTGALLVTEYAGAYGPAPPMRVERIGYGAGDRNPAGRPNVLRALLGESLDTGAFERVVVLECQIDDMNPQLYGALMERLAAAGALDVFYAPIQMKKNRPGTLVTVVAPPGRREALSDVLFRESTTIGLRVTETERERLDREEIAVETPLGAVRFKLARRGGALRNAAPEFEDCARLAAERRLSIKDVQAIAVKAWLDRNAEAAP